MYSSLSTRPRLIWVCFRLFIRCVLLVRDNCVFRWMCCLFVVTFVAVYHPWVNVYFYYLEMERFSHLFSADTFCFSCTVCHLVCKQPKIAAAHLRAGPQLASVSLLFVSWHFLQLADQIVVLFACHSTVLVSPAFLSTACFTGQFPLEVELGSFPLSSSAGDIPTVHYSGVLQYHHSAM